jgi:hypothetical protein
MDLSALRWVVFLAIYHGMCVQFRALTWSGNDLPGHFNATREWPHTIVLARFERGWYIVCLCVPLDDFGPKSEPEQCLSVDRLPYSIDEFESLGGGEKRCAAAGITTRFTAAAMKPRGGAISDLTILTARALWLETHPQAVESDIQQSRISNGAGPNKTRSHKSAGGLNNKV